MLYCDTPSAIAPLIRVVLAGSSRYSRIVAVTVMTSAAGIRPGMSERGMSRSAITAWSVELSMYRISSCWCGGEEERNRVFDWAAALVWGGERPREPGARPTDAGRVVSPAPAPPVQD